MIVTIGKKIKNPNELNNIKALISSYNTKNDRHNDPSGLRVLMVNCSSF